jgi:hypothetical protein
MYTPNIADIPLKNQERASIVIEEMRQISRQIDETIKIAQAGERPAQRQTEERLASLWAYRRDLATRLEMLEFGV